MEQDITKNINIQLHKHYHKLCFCNFIECEINMRNFEVFPYFIIKIIYFNRVPNLYIFG